MRFAFAFLLAAMAFIEKSSAATCESGSLIACSLDDGAWGRQEDYYAAREAYCGGDKWKTTSCYKHKTKTVPIYIQNDKPGANNRQVCWDATENIIQQCYRKEAFGSYSYNGQKYRMGSCSIWSVC